MAIAIEASNGYDQQDASPLSQSITLPSGTDCLVVAISNYDSGVDVQNLTFTMDATFDGVSLTAAVSYDWSTTNRQYGAHIFYMLNPTTGSAKTLSAVYNYSQKLQMTYYALSGVDTADPLGMTHTYNGGGGNTTDIVESVTPDTANSLLIATCHAGTNLTPPILTEDADTTEDYLQRWGASYGASVAAGHRTITSITSYDIGWTADSGHRVTLAVAEFQQAVAGGGNALPQAMNTYRRRRS